tara:strand:- start:324 stop:569 length:246 start_codon:yes stop_codon:yes gene_type:complete
MSSEFNYEVYLKPENEKKWQEIMNDKDGMKTMSKIYKFLIDSDIYHANDIIDKAYASYKEGRLDDHFEIFEKIYSAHLDKS